MISIAMEILGLLTIPVTIILMGAACNLVQGIIATLARAITRPKTNRKVRV